MDGLAAAAADVQVGGAAAAAVEGAGGLALAATAAVAGSGVGGNTSLGASSRKATSGTVTPMMAAMTTSVGEFTARYSSASDSAPTSAPIASLPSWRIRPCGASEYSMLSSVAVSTATGWDGWAKPVQSPRISTP